MRSLVGVRDTLPGTEARVVHGSQRQLIKLPRPPLACHDDDERPPTRAKAMADGASGPRALFGGALELALPRRMLDASLVRDVPDTQEVFVSRQDVNLSLIVDLAELVTPEDYLDSLLTPTTTTTREQAIRLALETHVDALAHDNDALSCAISSLSIAPLPSSSSALDGPHLISATQRIAKFNNNKSAAHDKVAIDLALWRLASHSADIVLSVNRPIIIIGKGEGEGEGDEAHASRVFGEAVRSLRLIDEGLFAGPPLQETVSLLKLERERQRDGQSVHS